MLFVWILNYLNWLNTLNKHPIFFTYYLIKLIWALFIMAYHFMGTQFLPKGLGWPVKNENSIVIWSDNWIPTFSYFKPFSLQGVFTFVTHVCHMFKIDSKSWDWEQLESVFNSVDMHITKIPIVVDNVEDTLV